MQLRFEKSVTGMWDMRMNRANMVRLRTASGYLSQALAYALLALSLVPDVGRRGAGSALAGWPLELMVPCLYMCLSSFLRYSVSTSLVVAMQEGCCSKATLSAAGSHFPFSCNAAAFLEKRALAHWRCHANRN